jgi:hypothetical protein
MEVLVAEHDLMTANDQAYRMKVTRIIEHPDYNTDTTAQDFSMLVLAEKLHFSK